MKSMKSSEQFDWQNVSQCEIHTKAVIELEPRKMFHTKACKLGIPTLSHFWISLIQHPPQSPLGNTCYPILPHHKPSVIGYGDKVGDRIGDKDKGTGKR